MSILFDPDRDDQFSPGFVVFDDDDASGAQRPVCRYVWLTERALCSPLTATDKRALAIYFREAERQRQLQRLAANEPWRGPSIPELARQLNIDERTFRRSRDHLREAELLRVVPHPTSVRTPDAYALRYEHPLLQGDIVTMPTALLAATEPDVGLVVGMIAWINGSRGPRPISLDELGRRLGLGRSRAGEIVDEAIRLGHLGRISRPGYPSAYALLDSGWWRRPGALIEGRAPRRVEPTRPGSAGHLAPVRDLPVRCPGSAGQVSGIRRSGVRDLPVPMIPSLIPSGSPEGSPSHTHRRAGCAGTSDGLGLATSPTGRGLRPRAYEMPPDSAAEDRTEGEGTTPRDRGEGATRPLDAPPVPPAPPTGVEDLSAALHRMEERWAAVCDQMDRGVRHGWDPDDRAQVEHRVREVAADVGDLGAALARVEAALDLHLRTWRDRCAHHYWLSRCPTDPYPAIEVFVGKMFGELLREVDGAPMKRRKARVSRKRELLDRDEFDHESAKRFPRIGWADLGSNTGPAYKGPKIGWG